MQSRLTENTPQNGMNATHESHDKYLYIYEAMERRERRRDREREKMRATDSRVRFFILSFRIGVVE